MKKMNKEEFTKELSKETGRSIEECSKINSIVEDIFIIGKKNKEKMIERMKAELQYNDEEANKVYETIMDILQREVKNKIKHPFKSLD